MSKQVKKALPALLLAVLLVVEFLVIAQAAERSRKEGLELEEVTGEAVWVANSERADNLEIRSNRYGHPFLGTDNTFALTLEGYEFLVGNENLEIWIDQDSFDIRVLDRETGYIWGGIEQELAQDLNRKWKTLGASLVMVDCYDKKLAEKTFYSADADTVKHYQVQGEAVAFEIGWQDIGLELQFTLTLQEKGINISMNDAGIVESGEYLLAGVTFLPFFGAARLDDIEGYFFLPDGCGALMRFGKSVDYISGYAKKIYGSDIGVESTAAMNNISDIESRPREFSIPQQNILFPVYGTVHGVEENAYWAEIESGAEYAVIQADAAGRNLNYHYIRVRYTYRDSYIQPTSKNGSGVRTVQDEKNRVNPSQTFYFLEKEDADYAGMAAAYREKLKKEGILQAWDMDEAHMEALIKIIAAVRDRGYLTNSTVTVTSPEYVKYISEDLAASSLDGLIFGLEGWMQGGYGGYNLKKIRAEEQFADRKELQVLSQELESRGNQLLLAYDLVRMTRDQYILKTDIATKISQQQAVSTIDNEEVLFQDTYYRRNELIKKYGQELYGWFSENEFQGMAGGIGEYLYSDYLRGEETNRTQAMTVQMELAQQGRERVRTYVSPFQYLWGETRNAVDVPVYTSQYLYFTDTVPFLQMVLHGSIDCFGEALNQGTYSRTSLLRLIEYGMYPSFLITEENNYRLKDSALYDVYTTQYENWRDDIVAACREIEQALGNIKDAEMTDHETLEEGLVKVSYSNGSCIYINYTIEDKTTEGLTVDAMSWLERME